MRLLSRLILAIAFLSFIFIQDLTAQEKKKLPKFGKVSKEELDMNSYDLDPEARAVILFDKGKTTFEYNRDNEAFQTVLKRHLRIKILKETGYDWGNFAIPYYTSVKGNIKIKALKAITVYKEKGKVQEMKLEKKDIYEEKTSKYWRQKKFSMPQLTKGAIIDVTYETISDFVYELPDWQFQYDIPAIWTEYTTEIPEYFVYNLNSQGYIPFTIYETDKSVGAILNPGEEVIDFMNNIRYFAIADVPALEKEPFTSSIDNYQAAIFFELAEVKFPNSIKQDFSNKWSNIDAELMKDFHFGLELQKENVLKKEIIAIQQEYDNRKDQFLAIYELIRNTVTWNGEYGIYTNKGLNKTFSDQEGSVADINILLTTALRNAGFDAHPVLLSTRENGLVPPTRPSLSAFNYVISSIQIEEQIVLLDATTVYCPLGMLPQRCLNDKGRLIDTNSTWVDLSTNRKYDTVTQYDVKLDDEMQLTGELKYIYKDYGAYDFLLTVQELNGENLLAESIMEQSPNLKLLNENVSYDESYTPIKVNFDVSYSDAITTADNFLYLNPMLDEAITDNPFKSETRQYPVDFAYPIKKTYIFKMPIPKGYRIEELPEKMVVTLPEKSGKYTYTTVVNDNMIQVISKFEIRKTIFLPEEYSYLREFYDQAIEKQAEQIVLVKE